MTYRYEEHNPWLFSDDGQRQLIKMRDWVKSALSTTGAFTASNATAQVKTPDSQKAYALLDRLVELGDVVEVAGQTCVSQHRVYTAARWPSF